MLLAISLNGGDREKGEERRMEYGIKFQYIFTVFDN